MSTPLLDIEAIAARANAATPGPWELDARESWDIVVWGPKRLTDGAYGKAGDEELAFNIGNDIEQVGAPAGDHHVANGEFVTHARTDVPALIEEVRRLRGRSWALSVILAHIKDGELGRTIGKLDISEIDRFSAVVNGYHLDLAARDAALSSPKKEGGE